MFIIKVTDYPYSKRSSLIAMKELRRKFMTILKRSKILTLHILQHKDTLIKNDLPYWLFKYHYTSLL